MDEKERLGKKRATATWAGMGGIQEEEKEELLRREKPEKGRNGSCGSPLQAQAVGTGHRAHSGTESQELQDGGRLPPTTLAHTHTGRVMQVRRWIG